MRSALFITLMGVLGSFAFSQLSFAQAPASTAKDASSQLQIEADIRESLKSLLYMEQEAYAENARYKNQSDIKYTFPPKLNGLVRLSITISGANGQKLKIQLDGIGDPISGKQYSIDESGTINGMSQFVTDNKLDNEIQKLMEGADLAMKSYFAEWNTYTTDFQKLGMAVPEHLKKIGTLNIQLTGSDYKIEYVGTSAPIQGKRYTRAATRLAKPAASPAASPVAPMPINLPPASPPQIPGMSFSAQTIPNLMFSLMTKPYDAGKKAEAPPQPDLPFQKASKNDVFPKVDLKQTHPFGDKFRFFLQEHPKDIYHTAYIYDLQMKPVAIIFNLTQYNNWQFQSKLYFYWQGLAHGKTGWCRLSLSTGEGGCAANANMTIASYEFSPHEKRMFMRPSPEEVLIYSFGEESVIGLVQANKIQWQDDETLRADGKAIKFADLKAAQESAIQKQQPCLRFIQSLKSQFAKGKYSMMRNFAMEGVPGWAGNKIAEALSPNFGARPSLELFTDDPLKDLAPMQRLDPKCEYLHSPKDRDALNLYQGSSLYFETSLLHEPGYNACEANIDCGSSQISINGKLYYFNQKMEAKALDLISKLKPSYLDASANIREIHVVCEQNRCVDRPANLYEYPQGLLPGPAKRSWMDALATKYGTSPALEKMTEKYYPDLINLSFKPQATIQQVNDLLKSEGLGLHETLRGRPSVQLWARKIKTVKERNQLISKLQKNPIVATITKVEIPAYVEACLVSGGTQGSKGCTWSDPSVDFKKVLSDPVKECARVGAKYIQFPTTCQDDCEIDPSINRLCGDMITQGCDCGPNRCWHRGTCMQNPKPIGPKLHQKLNPDEGMGDLEEF